MDTIEQRVLSVRERMARSASRVGRRVSDIQLMAVTKTRTTEEMLEVASRVDSLGENRVQEASSKKRDWPAAVSVAWRLIGHLQTNKARKALSVFDGVDSVDSVALALTLERIAAETDRVVPVLLEVNTSGESAKTGVAPERFPELLDSALNCPHLRLDGLMTLGPLTLGPATQAEAEARGAFARLRETALEARLRSGLPLPVLSMGMSDDFEWAILEGSTVVRIGTALFGARAQGVADLGVVDPGGADPISTNARLDAKVT
jgi:pyridoxal phosphate enzyme (YggS family)